MPPLLPVTGSAPLVPQENSLNKLSLNKQILNKIASLGDITSNDIVLEVGPGTGNLTEKILEKKPKKLVVVYKHKNL